MPQLQAKSNNGTNIAVDLSHMAQKGTSPADSVPRNDSVNAQKGGGTNNSSGGNSGSVHKPNELGFINVEALTEEGKSDKEILVNSSITPSVKDLQGHENATSE